MLYAFDAVRESHLGVRQREWEAVGGSELTVVREMARCLALIREGKVPK